MTLLELQEVLGDTLSTVVAASDNTAISDDDWRKTLSMADAVSRIAKQMINNADIVLRRDKLEAEGKVGGSSAISKIVGG